jgi:hypothetical protein
MTTTTQATEDHIRSTPETSAAERDALVTRLREMRRRPRHACRLAIASYHGKVTP